VDCLYYKVLINTTGVREDDKMERVHETKLVYMNS